MDESDIGVAPAGTTTKSGFFAVDQVTWATVCSVGLNAAVAYLVLARGSGRDHQHTAWSADAIERKTGISWRRAHSTHRDHLVRAIVITRSRAS